MRINVQIWNIPKGILVHLCTCGHSLANCVLMASGECREHKLTNIRRARENFHARVFCVSFTYGLNIAEIKFRVNSLGIHVECHVYNIEVSCAFTVSKKTAFGTVGTGKQGKFCRSNACTAVIVTVCGNDYSFTV